MSEKLRHYMVNDMINILAKTACILFFIISLISTGCKDESILSPTVIRDTVYIPKDTVIKSFMIDKVILPTNPKVGDIFRIAFKNKPVDIYVNDFSISNRYSEYESVNGDTVISFWPVLPKMKILMFTVGLANYNTYAFSSASKWITTDYEVVNGVKVMKSNEAPVERNRYYPTFLRQREHRYTLTEKGDTVIIGLFFQIHDEASESMHWKFLSRKGELPKFIEHTRRWNESDGAHSVYYTDTLKNGVVKIDKWDEGGVYSGIVYAELEPYSEVRFMRPKTTFFVKRN